MPEPAASRATPPPDDPLALADAYAVEMLRALDRGDAERWDAARSAMPPHVRPMAEDRVSWTLTASGRPHSDLVRLSLWLCRPLDGATRGNERARAARARRVGAARELRGLPASEAALALGVGEATVKRYWRETA